MKSGIVKNHREKIRMRNGDVIKEKNWLEHWKSNNVEKVERIRRKKRKQNRFTREQTIEKLVDEELLNVVISEPMKDGDGNFLLYFGHGDDSCVDPRDVGEVDYDEKVVLPPNNNSYDKLYKTLDKLCPKDRDIIKMYFSLEEYSLKRNTIYDISQKYNTSEATVFNTIKKLLAKLKGLLT